MHIGLYPTETDGHDVPPTATPVPTRVGTWDALGPPVRPRTRLRTHDVVNQVAPFADVDLFGTYPALGELLARYGGEWARPRLEEFGRIAGSARMLELGAICNRDVPRLHRRDRYGQRIDEIEFSPAYHEIMDTYVRHELGSLSWRHPGPGATVAQMALQLLGFAPEAGVLCPMAMTYGAPDVLAPEPTILEPWRSRLLSREYDPRNLPIEDKTWALLGLNLTEKQGGSDLRAVSTRAEAVGSRCSGEPYLLTGHKWYCSGAQFDAFVTVAQTEHGPTAFAVPRWLPDGTRNDYDVVALKDKMGNRSNPTAEIEMDHTWGRMIGEEGGGIKVALRFLRYSRLGFAVTPAGLMRQALVYALHFARRRHAFGARLIDKPLMRNVLADLALESEAATAMVLRIAKAYDAAAAGDDREDAFGRLTVTLAKYRLNKRAIGFLGEVMELHGAQGYMEDSPLPRFFREIHFSVVGEGPSNVMCLDVLRAVVRSPAALDAVLAEIRTAHGRHRELDRTLRRLDELRPDQLDERDAREVTDTLAVALQAAILFDTAPEAVATAFADARLGAGGSVYGTLPASADEDLILQRAYREEPAP